MRWNGPTARQGWRRCDPVIRTGFPLQPGLVIHQGLSQMRSRRARRLPARRAVRTTSARSLSLAPMQLGLPTDDLFVGARELKEWLFREAEMAVPNEDIARRFVADCRRTRTVPRYRSGRGSSIGCIRCRSGAVRLGSGVRRLARADPFAKLEGRQRILGLSRCSPGNPCAWRVWPWRTRWPVWSGRSWYARDLKLVMPRNLAV